MSSIQMALDFLPVKLTHTTPRHASDPLFSRDHGSQMSFVGKTYGMP